MTVLRNELVAFEPILFQYHSYLWPLQITIPLTEPLLNH
jgi:hypothetical protein